MWVKKDRRRRRRRTRRMRRKGALRMMGGKHVIVVGRVPGQRRMERNGGERCAGVGVGVCERRKGRASKRRVKKE